jgi:hypothetical protein
MVQDVRESTVFPCAAHEQLYGLLATGELRPRKVVEPGLADRAGDLGLDLPPDLGRFVRRRRQGRSMLRPGELLAELNPLREGRWPFRWITLELL